MGQNATPMFAHKDPIFKLSDWMLKIFNQSECLKKRSVKFTRKVFMELGQGSSSLFDSANVILSSPCRCRRRRYALFNLFSFENILT